MMLSCPVVGDVNSSDNAILSEAVIVNAPQVYRSHESLQLSCVCSILLRLNLILLRN